MYHLLLYSSIYFYDTLHVNYISYYILHITYYMLYVQYVRYGIIALPYDAYSTRRENCLNSSPRSTNTVALPYILLLCARTQRGPAPSFRLSSALDFSLHAFATDERGQHRRVD